MKNKDDIIHQFDAYCKMVLRCEKIDYYREKRYRMEHEVFLCDLKEVLLDKYFVTQDSYTLGDTFSVMGYEVTVCDECLSKALKKLPKKKREVILMSFYLGMSDTEISRIFGMARSSIHFHRVSALEKLRKAMEGMDNGKGL